MRETLVFLSLIGDSGLHPHTRYAHWFLNSLYLISATAIVYSLFALFRPVRYLFRTQPKEREEARQICAVCRWCLAMFPSTGCPVKIPDQTNAAQNPQRRQNETAGQHYKRRREQP